MRPGIALVLDALRDLASCIGGALFWTVDYRVRRQPFPVRMPRGTLVSVAIAPIVAAMALGGPTAAGWVALIGTTEVREVRGRIPWYGTAANHAGVVLPALAGGLRSMSSYVVAPTIRSLHLLATIAGAVASVRAQYLA